MIAKRPPHKPDPFAVLVLMVMVSLSVTIAYQINLYYNSDLLNLARNAQSQRAIK